MASETTRLEQVTRFLRRVYLWSLPVAAIGFVAMVVLLVITGRHSITFEDAEAGNVASVLLGRNPGRVVYVTRGFKTALTLAEAAVFWCLGAGVAWVVCRGAQDRAARRK